jgi:hypothetical protein
MRAEAATGVAIGRRERGVRPAMAGHAATVALSVSLHGPVAPLVLTQREREWACMPPLSDSKLSDVSPRVTLPMEPYSLGSIGAGWCGERDEDLVAMDTGGSAPSGHGRFIRQPQLVREPLPALDQRERARAWATCRVP